MLAGWQTAVLTESTEVLDSTDRVSGFPAYAIRRDTIHAIMGTHDTGLPLCTTPVRLCVQAELTALAERQAANKHKLEEYHHLKVIMLC